MKQWFVIILIFLLAGCVGAPESIPEFGSPQWERLSPNKKREWARGQIELRTNMYLQKRGYRLGTGPHSMFRNIYESAAFDINQETRETQPAKLQEAITNIQTFVDRMIVEVGNIPDYEQQHFRKIVEQPLDAAWKALCPLWPIC